MDKLPLRYRLRAMWLSACILAFWHDEKRVQGYAYELGKVLEHGSLHLREEVTGG